MAPQRAAETGPETPPAAPSGAAAGGVLSAGESASRPLATGRCELRPAGDGGVELVIRFDAEASAVLRALAAGSGGGASPDSGPGVLRGIHQELARLRRALSVAAPARSAAGLADSVTPGEAARVLQLVKRLNDGPRPRRLRLQEVFERVVLEYGAQALYEQGYCARGNMENRIKEQKLDLFADRTSTGTLRANQLRLWLSTVAYLLVNQLRRVGLAGTKLAQATCGTIRLRLFKIGAVVRVTVRRVWVSLSSAFPLQDLFGHVAQRLLAVT